jgi:N-acetyl sugar amidotransferase
MKNKRCKKCIIDTTVPGVIFDEKGVCNFCHLQDKMEKEFPTGSEGKKKLLAIVERIKNQGEGKKYDCVVGISGGRDSSFILYYATKKLGLRVLAVHFNDGFGNPTAGENMIRVCHKLHIDLRTITSDWRESKEIRLVFLKASTPDLPQGTDVGIAAALYGVATKENVKYVLIGQSFRTEGIAPLSWNYLDGKYLKAVLKQFGKVILHKWSPTNPGFNLGLWEMFYYIIIKRIQTIPLLYYVNYIRSETDKLLIKEFDWKNPGAHYADDLYQSLMTYVLRKKFNIDRRLFNYSALIRSNQMKRDEALAKIREKYTIENKTIIDLCIKRLGITRKEFESYLKIPVKSFRDYPNNYYLIQKLKIPIKFLCKINLLPGSAYDKYFNCGQ